MPIAISSSRRHQGNKQPGQGQNQVRPDQQGGGQRSGQQSQEGGQRNQPGQHRRVRCARRSKGGDNRTEQQDQDQDKDRTR